MKLTALILSTTLTFSLLACGDNTPKQEEKKDEKTAQTEKNKEPEAPKPTEISEEAKKIAKNWQLKTITHVDGKKDAIKATLKLKTDGSFEEILNAKTIATGTWDVKDKTLLMRHLTGDLKEQTEKLIIKEVSDKKLVTVDDEGKMSETYEAE